jgi:hypothetical protein
VIRALNEGEVSPVTRPSATRFIVVKRTYSLSIEENGDIEGEKPSGVSRSNEREGVRGFKSHPRRLTESSGFLRERPRSNHELHFGRCLS